MPSLVVYAGINLDEADLYFDGGRGLLATHGQNHREKQEQSGKPDHPSTCLHCSRACLISFGLMLAKPANNERQSLKSVICVLRKAFAARVSAISPRSEGSTPRVSAWNARKSLNSAERWASSSGNILLSYSS